jgi:hypothetical protein
LADPLHTPIAGEVYHLKDRDGLGHWPFDDCWRVLGVLSDGAALMGRLRVDGRTLDRRFAQQVTALPVSRWEFRR